MSPKLSFKLLAGEELAQAEEQWAYSSLVEKCRLWAVSMCRLVHRHDWYLEISPYEGVHLGCRKCPGDINDLCPDGSDLIIGEFEVYPGYVLSLDMGDVRVNGADCDGFFTYGWRGPVTARVEVVRYPSTPDHGEECDVWVELEARQ